MARQVIILNYHHVGTVPRGFARRRLWVTPLLLALHIRFLRALGYTFTTVSQAFSVPFDRVACVTFDDGFADVVEHGAALLRSLGVPATVYVVTDDVGRQAISFPEDDGTGAFDLAGWDDLRALAAVGCEIGSHAAVHRRLARLPPHEQRTLLARSCASIASNLGEPPRSLAYPYGSYSPETLAIAREVGFETAVTTRRGVVRGPSDMLQLPRVTMGGQNLLHAARVTKLLLAHVRLLPRGHHAGSRMV